MSLVLGLNLPQYLYLVSDTRLTMKNNEYRDNFCKFYSFSDNLSVVVAGNAGLANFILNKISELGLANSGFRIFEDSIDERIRLILDDYMGSGKKHASAFLIFAGFDKISKKLVSSSQYGNTLANTFIPGQKQTINKEIIQKLVEAAVRNGPGDRKGEKSVIGSLEKDTMLEIDFPYSSIITVEVHLPYGPVIKKIDCYKYVIKAPGGLNEFDLPYKLEKQQSASKTGEETIQAQSVVLMAWVSKIIKDNKLETVGGEIMVNMITPEGAIIMTGAMTSLNTNTKEIKKISEIVVHEGNFCVRHKDGKLIPLENIYNFDKEGEFEL